MGCKKSKEKPVILSEPLKNLTENREIIRCANTVKKGLEGKFKYEIKITSPYHLKHGIYDEIIPLKNITTDPDILVLRNINYKIEIPSKKLMDGASKLGIEFIGTLYTGYKNCLEAVDSLVVFKEKPIILSEPLKNLVENRKIIYCSNTVKRGLEGKFDYEIIITSPYDGPKVYHLKKGVYDEIIPLKNITTVPNILVLRNVNYKIEIPSKKLIDGASNLGIEFIGTFYVGCNDNLRTVDSLVVFKEK
jgi:hypothetical protein